MGLKEKLEEMKAKRRKQEEMRKEKLIEEEIIEPIVAGETEEEKARKLVMAVKENPGLREDIVKKVDEADEISQGVIDRAAVTAANSETVPNEVTVEIGKKASDKTTVQVLQDESMPVSKRVELAGTINSEEQQIAASYINIKRLYNSLNGLVPQEELVGKIKTLLENSKKTDRELHQIYKVLAKNSAILYHERNGSLNMRSMEQVVPLNELIRAGMPKMIEEEYMCLLDEDEESKFNLEEVTNRFLKREAQRVVREAKNTGVSVGSIIEDMGNLSEEEVEYFLEVLAKNNENLTDLDLEIARHKLSENEQENYNVKDLISEVVEEGVPKEQGEKYVSIMNQLSEDELKALEDCINSGLIKNLSTKSEEERKGYLDAINSSIKKRELMEKAKTAKKLSREEMPKVNRAERKDGGIEIE